MSNKTLGLLMFIAGMLIIIFGLALILINTFAPPQQAYQGYVEGRYVSPLVSGPVSTPTIEVIFRGEKSTAGGTTSSDAA